MSTEDVIITQPAGVRTLALRESYLAICDGDKCEAHLLNANERWYAYKLKQRQQARHSNKAAEAGGESPDADESLWVFMSATEWVTELLKVYDEKTIRRKLASLVERGFLSTRSNPKRRWDRKPQWLFVRANVQAAVDAWAASREAPDLDPSTADQTETTDLDESGNADDCTRANARMDSGKVPNASGQSSASIRANARSNTTGIFHRDLSQESFTGGEYNVTGDAREAQSGVAAQPITAPVAEPRPSPVTTGDKGSTDMKAVREQPAEMAVLSPDGEAADAANAAGKPSYSLDDLEGGHETLTAPPLEDVPGGPRGAQEGQEDPSALASAPHDPQETRAVLVRALGGNAKLNVLMEETPPGLRAGVIRRAWITAITPERAQELVNEGRASKTQHPWTAIGQLLDQEIGGQIVRGQGRQPGVVTLPGAYQTPEEKAVQAATLPVVEVGSRWVSRKSGKVYTIEDVTSQTVCVQDAGEYPVQRFHKIFQAAD